MSRFERRKTTRENRQGGSIYTNNNNNNNRVSSSTPRLNNNNQQLLTVIKKHDELLTRLLKRFNDMENTLNAKIESLIENKINQLNEEFQAKLNSIDMKNSELPSEYDNTSVEYENTIIEDDEDIKDINNNIINDVILDNNENIDLNNMNELLLGINDDVVKKVDFAHFASDIKNSVNNIFQNITEKNQQHNLNQTNLMKSIIGHLNYNTELKTIVNNYEENKNEMFYKNKKSAENFDKDAETNEKKNDNENENEDEIKKEVSEDIKQKKEGTTLVIDVGENNNEKNLELEIVEN